MAEQNPLYVLRDFVIGGKLSEIKEEGGDIVFGDVLRVPSDTETIYRNGSHGDHVTIISALLVAKSNHRFQYVSEMGKRKIAKFIGNDKMFKDLSDYLKGTIEDSANLEHDKTVTSAKKRKTTDKSESVREGGEGGAARSSTTPQHAKHTRINGQISMEVASRDRNQLLTSPGIDYSYALELYQQAHLKKMDGGETVPLSADPSTYLKKKRDSRLPIIIVPNTSTALMSMFNAKQFVTEGKFVEGAKLAASGVVKNSSEIFTRKITSLGSQGGAVKEAQYLVIDNPSRLADKEWDRVVAVVSVGKEWQFKGWKWSTPVELFSHALGLYVKWDNEAVPPIVTKWNVKILDISKNRRSLDSSANIKFWSMVDDYTRINNAPFYRGF